MDDSVRKNRSAWSNKPNVLHLPSNFGINFWKTLFDLSSQNNILVCTYACYPTHFWVKTNYILWWQSWHVSKHCYSLFHALHTWYQTVLLLYNTNTIMYMNTLQYHYKELWYRIEGNFGDRKIWWIWQLTMYSLNFCHPNFYNT